MQVKPKIAANNTISDLTHNMLEPRKIESDDSSLLVGTKDKK